PPPSTRAGAVANPKGAAQILFDAFIGADLFLADNDRGFPFAIPGSSAGSHGADGTCTTRLQYDIAFVGSTPPDRYSANFYSTIWSEISAGNLSNTVASGCLDDGAALEWHEALGATPITIGTAISFTGQAIPVGAAVPALSV